MRLFIFVFVIFLSVFATPDFTVAQDHSIARDWNEEVLHAIRNDFARPTVHARNLWHSSVLMYDIWALLNADSGADTYLIGKTIQGYTCPSIDLPDYAESNDEVVRIAISHGIYTLMSRRFRVSPGWFSEIRNSIRQKMQDEGLNFNYTIDNYQNGNPAALGNYIANQIMAFGLQDGSNEQISYGNTAYMPVNDPLIMLDTVIQEPEDPNRWQPLTLDVFIDQSGNPIPFNTPEFLSPEWGQVVPFALSENDLTVYNRDNFDYHVYHDPGPPPYVDLDEKTELSEAFLDGFAMVSVWGSHLDPADGVMWDISPASIGNIPQLPSSIQEYPAFYDMLEGGDASLGHDLNPSTGLAYAPNMVPRADYARVLAEFWADGPDSETPPGHWFTIMNYVHDHPEFVRSYKGITDEIEPLEWDIKAYFLLGSAMHDCAVTAWGIKGWYDYLRPVSAIRTMAARGQSTIENFPNYHPAGIPLIDDKIEIIAAGDPLAGSNGQNIGKIKLYTWRGPDFIDNPDSDIAGVGWILAEKWWPYQRPSFVTPPFAGYVSGHSTYSRAAADILAYITGDEFFPGGMAEFVAPANEFLVFEDGPSVDVTLQWATYRDASDQTSLSRIWGGIHPPADDVPGRRIGVEIAEDVLIKAESIFYVDVDGDGFYNYQDCDDNDPMINPMASEICDGIDNNCSKEIDEGLQLYTYFQDFDGDGYGNVNVPVDTCRANPIAGFVANALDCNDDNDAINPDAIEFCDGVDNDCSGQIDENLEIFRYYRDSDGDGFGNPILLVDTCRANPISGFVIDNTDCDDSNPAINPDSPEICDSVDNDCTGRADDGLPTIRYYQDVDVDGYGNEAMFVDTCITWNPVGFVDNALDCNDADVLINPDAIDISDNTIDEDCNGFDLFKISKIFPNPFIDQVTVHFDSQMPVKVLLYDRIGQIVVESDFKIMDNFFVWDLTDLAAGVYFFRIIDEDDNELYSQSVLKAGQK